VLVEALRDQVIYLKEQLYIRTEELSEHRRLLAGLIEGVTELEAPDEPLAAPSQSGEEAAQEPEKAAPNSSSPPRLDSAEAKNGSQRPLVAKTVRLNFRVA
jgi:hypothetical protein